MQMVAQEGLAWGHGTPAIPHGQSGMDTSHRDLLHWICVIPLHSYSNTAKLGSFRPCPNSALKMALGRSHIYSLGPNFHPVADSEQGNCQAVSSRLLAYFCPVWLLSWSLALIHQKAFLNPSPSHPFLSKEYIHYHLMSLWA